MKNIEGAIRDYSEDLLENLNTVKMILLEYPKSRRVQELWLNKRQENNDDRE